MERRRVLASLAVVEGGVAGCVGRDQPASVSETHTPNERVDLPYTITIRDPSANVETDELPEITFRQSPQEVVVTGGMHYGSGSCNELAVSELDLTDAGTLAVTVGAATKEDAPRTCTDDNVPAEYELVVSVQDTLPQRVQVTERPYDSDPRQTTATPNGTR